MSRADFYPPRLAPILLGFVQTVLPLLACWCFRLKLELVPGVLPQAILLFSRSPAVSAAMGQVAIIIKYRYTQSM